MGIQKTKETSFRRVRSGFAVSRYAVRKSSEHIDPLAEKEEGTEQGERVDPSRFMNRKQRKAWRRLSPAKRRQYIRRAQRQLKKDHAGQGIALKKTPYAVSGREAVTDPETAKKLAGWQTGRKGYGKVLPSLRRL